MLDAPQPSELSDLVRLQRAELEERLAGGLCPDAARELTGGRGAGTSAHLGSDWRAWLTGVLTAALRRVRRVTPVPPAPPASAEPEIRRDPRRRISSGRMPAVRG
jgi:hypothetical protein